MSNNRKTYDFKSVGQLQNTYDQQQFDTVRKTPIGILTPVSFATTDGSMFSMSYNVIDQIKDNLKNLLLTNKGERLMLNDFGADIRRLGLEMMNDDIATTAIRQISSTVGKYMPFIDLQNFETRNQASEDGNTVGIVVRVTYAVPSIGVTNQAVEVVIHAAG